MRRLSVLLIVATLLSTAADAAWVKRHKRPVSALEGFGNSVRGAVRDVMPWNWGRKPEKKGYYLD